MSDEIANALDNLRVHQRQLDADGCEVGVSRQALNEVIADYGRVHIALERAERALAERAGGVKECATEGCDNAATIRFERGGVGSDYCGPCYLKVQAIPHTITTEPAAPEGDKPTLYTCPAKQAVTEANPAGTHKPQQ